MNLQKQKSCCYTSITQSSRISSTLKNKKKKIAHQNQNNHSTDKDKQLTHTWPLTPSLYYNNTDFPPEDIAMDLWI